MADNGVLVTISGAALSLLLYENVRSTGDQMGLLLGNVQTFITKNVTDCDRQVEHVKYHINIDTVVLCTKDILQDSLGRINTEKLGNFIKNKEKNVVGWFRFRRHNFLEHTMRDKIMHKQFASHFMGFNGAPEEHFIMFLLNASTTTAYKSTHKYRHLCLQYKRGVFQPVSLRINNLGADAARHDGSDYKPVPEKKPKESDAFTKLVDDLKLNASTSSSVDIVTAIQKRADQYLNDLMSIVGKSDEEISDLQKQVNELSAKIQKGGRARNFRQKEKVTELNTNAENERIYTTSQIHGSPRSMNSDDLFGSDQSPTPINVLSKNKSSPNSNLATKNLNIERTKHHAYSKEFRNHSSPESPFFCDLIRSESSPESTRSKEGTPKLTNKVIERHSLSDFGDQSHEETSTFGRKEQSPRPTSFSGNR